jgi:hypothetical protein
VDELEDHSQFIDDNYDAPQPKQSDASNKALQAKIEELN